MCTRPVTRKGAQLGKMGACCSAATVGDLVDKEESDTSFQFNVTRPTMFFTKKKKTGDNDLVIFT